MFPGIAEGNVMVRSNARSLLSSATDLPEDSSPIQVADEALRMMGLRQGDLTPQNADIVDLAEWQDILERGDHIITRSHPAAIIEHHAIFLGRIRIADGSSRWSMVDMSGDDKENATIAVRPMSVLLKGVDQLLVIRYTWDADPVWKALTAKFSETLAASLTDRTVPRQMYNLIGNNCQHFATFCRTFRCVTSDHAHLKSALNAVPLPSRLSRFK